MEKSLEGQTILITGASRGLGKHLCLYFSALGLKVAAVSRNKDELKKLKDEIEKRNGIISTFAVSVTDYDGIGRVAKEVYNTWGSIDILINNAAIGFDTTFEDLTKEEIDTTIDINLKGLIYTTRHVVPLMMKKNCGSIFNISSVAGIRGINAKSSNNGIYTATKHGVNGFSDVMCKYLLKNNIHVTTLCPGGINTSWWDRWELPYDRKMLIEPGNIAKLIELILKLPEETLFKQAVFFPVCEADQS